MEYRAFGQEAPSPSGPGRVAALRPPLPAPERESVPRKPQPACPVARVALDARVLIVEDHCLVAGRSAAGAHRTRLGGRDHRRAGRRGHRGGRALPAAVRAARHRAGRRCGSGIDLIAPLRATGAEVVMLTVETRRSVLAACLEQGAGDVDLTRGAEIDAPTATSLPTDTRRDPHGHHRPVTLRTW